MGRVEVAQLGQRLFERAAHSSKRRGLFLDKLVVEDIDRRAKITGHGAQYNGARPGRATRGPGCRYFAL
ncbi:hypothetical protein GCM10010987_02630 [Bradyrhizobium guangdongense]|uniref:Uncharacterized protein n=1 Tax=Bradyrhizobium guangdongense TaxID=1325090 RepID=A0AA87W041_9BRAD|nr:hypothetical protein GCM10010987_02630 [Bradyrhizobium guangdongense]